MRLLIILMFAIAVIGCNDEKKKPINTVDSLNVQLMPDQVSHDIKVVFVDSSYTKAILTAKRARTYYDRMETLLDGGMKVVFMSEKSGKRISVLTADSARIDDKTKNMMALGNVVVISDSTDTKLETPELEWINKTRKLYSTEKVTVTTPNEIIYGKGFESDPKLDNYKIMNVSGISNIQK